MLKNELHLQKSDLHLQKSDIHLQKCGLHLQKVEYIIKVNCVSKKVNYACKKGLNCRPHDRPDAGSALF